MSLQDNINDALLALLKEYGLDAAKVTSYYDTTISSGYCETCYYESAAVRIYYNDSNGKQNSYLYNGGFGELIYELDRLS